MALRYYANTPATTLASSCTNVATSILVTSVTGLPVAYPYTLILGRGTTTEEAVDVSNAVGTTLTVTRGIDSTTAFAHDAGAEVCHGITARDIREANAHVNASSGVHGVVGSVVGRTDAQALTNKDLTSGTNSFPSSLATDVEVATAATTAATNLADHAADTSTHGVAVAVVGTTDVQTLTNKTLTAPVITGVGEIRYIAKGADESVTSSTTLQDDDHLTFSVAANATYHFELQIWIVDTIGNGHKLAFAVPASATYNAGAGTGINPATDNVYAASSGGTFGRTGSVRGTPTLLTISGTIVTAGTAGTATLQWAQVASDPTAVTFKAGSNILVRRVA